MKQIKVDCVLKERSGSSEENRPEGSGEAAVRAVQRPAGLQERTAADLGSGEMDGLGRYLGAPSTGFGDHWAPRREGEKV